MLRNDAVFPTNCAGEEGLTRLLLIASKLTATAVFLGTVRRVSVLTVGEDELDLQRNCALLCKSSWSELKSLGQNVTINCFSNCFVKC